MISVVCVTSECKGHQVYARFWCILLNMMVSLGTPPPVGLGEAYNFTILGATLTYNNHRHSTVARSLY